MKFEAAGRPFAKKVLLAAAIAALFPWAGSASEPGTVAHEAAPVAETRAGGSAPTHGVLVTWSSANGHYESPAPDQAARLVRELQRLLAGGLAERVGLATTAPIAQRTEGGLLMARVPARLVDLALVRVGAGGTFAGSCTQGPAATLQVLSQSPAAARLAER